MKIVDILVSVHADLPDKARTNIERDLQGCDGVMSAHFSAGHPHILEVAYNPQAINSETLLKHITERGFGANMFGL